MTYPLTVIGLVYLAYLSLLIELVLFPVPSAVSSYNLWRGNEDFGAEGKEIQQNSNQWSFGKKTALLFAPIVIIVITFLLPLFFVVFGAFSFSPFIFDPGFYLITVACLLIIAGRALTLVSVLTIRKNNRQQNNSFSLHRRGLFSRSRNPIQVGMYIFLLGLMVLFPSPIFFLGCIFYFFYMHYKILLEEKFLHLKFGANYQEYQSSSKRYF